LNRGKLSRSFGFWGGALTLALTGALVFWPKLEWLVSYLIAINIVTLRS
jgi:hypothetical protein